MQIYEPQANIIEDMLHALRVKPSNHAADEVTDLIMAAAADLQGQGVEKIEFNDPLTKQAVKLYCKAHYGYDSNSEKYLEAYQALSMSMALLSDY